MALRSRKPLILAAAALLLAAAPAYATKIGRIAMQKAGHYLSVEADGLTAPVLQKSGKKLIILIPGGEHGLKTLKVGSPPLVQVRFGKDGDTLHMVLDMDSSVQASISHL